MCPVESEATEEEHGKILPTIVSTSLLKTYPEDLGVRKFKHSPLKLDRLQQPVFNFTSY